MRDRETYLNIKVSGSRERVMKNGQILTLRPAKATDAAKMITYLNQVGGESDNLLFGADGFHFTVEQEENFVNQAAEDKETLMLLGLIEEEIVSIAHIGGAKRKRIAHNSDLGISVKKSHWGLGIGKAVMEELIQFGRTSDVIQIISLGVKKSNTNAIALYTKLGFEEIGRHKRFFNVNGEYDDEILMDLHL